MAHPIASSTPIGGFVDTVVPLRDGGLFVRGGPHGHVLVDDDGVHPLSPTPRRFPDHPAFSKGVVWERDGETFHCTPGQAWASHVFVVGPGREVELVDPGDDLQLGEAVPGRPGEMVCLTSSQRIARLDVSSRHREERSGAFTSVRRVDERIVAWSTDAVVVLDLELREIARRSYPWVFDVAVVGAWVVVVLRGEVLVLDASLEEYARMAHPGPGKALVDANAGWVHVADRDARVWTLDVNAARLRWQHQNGVSRADLVRAGDLLVALEGLSGADADDVFAGVVLSASYGGRVTAVAMPAPAARVVGLPGGAFACLWWREGETAIGDHQLAVWLSPRSTGEPTILDAPPTTHGLCVDARGRLVSFTTDGLVTRWSLPG